MGSHSGPSADPHARRIHADAELVEHLDADGAVIEIVSRARMRRERLRHRCTYIVVQRSSGAVVVHRRALWKDIYPGWWDLCFGGVSAVGEHWVAAARRELFEEAGLSGVPLWPLGEGRYEADDGSIIGQVYLVSSDTAVRANDAEVIAFEEVSLDELEQWAQHHQICADSRALVLPRLLELRDRGSEAGGGFIKT